MSIGIVLFEVGIDFRAKLDGVGVGSLRGGLG